MDPIQFANPFEEFLFENKTTLENQNIAEEQYKSSSDLDENSPKRQAIREALQKAKDAREKCLGKLNILQGMPSINYLKYDGVYSSNKPKSSYYTPVQIQYAGLDLSKCSYSDLVPIAEPQWRLYTLYNQESPDTHWCEKTLQNILLRLMLEVAKMTPCLKGKEFDFGNCQDCLSESKNTAVFKINSRASLICDTTDIASFSDSNVEDSLETPYGHMFENLLSLSLCYGVKTPYGILSNYNQTRICWIQSNSCQRPERILFVSDCIYTPEDHKSLLSAIACSFSNVLEGGHDEVIATTNIPTSTARYTTHFTKEVRKWALFPCLTLSHSMPTKHCLEKEGVFLLKYFHPGVEGCTYHVCSRRGEQCVLKFYYEQQTQTERSQERVMATLSLPRQRKLKLKTEVERWKNINNIDIYIAELDGTTCLVMPYLEPVSKVQKKEFVESCSPMRFMIRDLFVNLFATGRHFVENTWDHIGWYVSPSDGSKKLVFYDFGNLETLHWSKKRLRNGALKKGDVHGVLLDEALSSLDQQI